MKLSPYKYCEVKKLPHKWNYVFLHGNAYWDEETCYVVSDTPMPTTPGIYLAELNSKPVMAILYKLSYLEGYVIYLDDTLALLEVLRSH